MRKSFQAPGLAAVLALLTFTTTSGVLASSAPQADNLDSHGTAPSNDEISSGLTAEAHEAERSESGGLLSITWSIENNESEDIFFSWPSGDSYMYSNALTYSGVTITTPDESSRHHPIMDGDGACLCSGIVSADFKDRIRQDEKVAYWSLFSVPEDLDYVNLEIPGFEPIEDIPIT